MLNRRLVTLAAVVFVAPSLAASAATPAGSPAAKTTSQAGTYLAARHAEATSDDAKATSYLSRALAFDPENQNILRHSYFLGAQVGDFNSAAAAAMKSTDGAPQLALAPLIVTVNAFQKKKYDVAWSYLEKIPTQSAVGFALPMLRAWGMAPRQPAETTLAELAPLQSLNGAADLYNAMAGGINEYYGRTDQALVNYDALAQRADQLPPSILRIVVEAYRRMGKDDKAKDLIAHFTSGHRSALYVDGILDTTATPGRAPRRITPQEGMAEALFAACQMLLQNVNTAFGTQLAVVYGQAALYLNPDLVIARRVVAANLADRERLDEANSMLAAIKKDQTSYAFARLQMSENYERMERPAESLTLLEEVAKEKPDWPNVYVAIGDHMRRVKKFTEAVEAYDHAFKLYPQGEPALWQLYYARGISLERTKQWERADADFRKALALKPDDAGVLNYLGYSLIDRGIKVSEGRSLIEKAFKLKPDDGYIIDSLGWAMYLMGETENAVVHLEKAVETNPSDPTINDHLGDAYWKVGRKHEAFFQWKRALGLDPDEEQRAGLQHKLTQGFASNEVQPSP